MTGAEAERLVRQSDRHLRTLENRAIADLRRTLDQSINTMRHELRVLYGRIQAQTASLGAPIREAVIRQQLEELQVIRRSLDLPAGSVDAILRELNEGAFNEGADSAMRALSIWDREVTGLRGTTRLGVMAQGTNITARLTEIGNARVLNGRARLLQHTATAAQRIQDHVIDGITRGVGWGRTARAVQGDVNLLYYEAERLVRTESVEASDTARRAQYAEAGVEYVQIMATADDRVCGYCAASSGQVYPLGEIQLPRHPNCRCYAAPYRAEWAALGLDDHEWAEDHHAATVARAQERGEPIRTGPAPSDRWRGLTSAPQAVPRAELLRRAAAGPAIGAAVAGSPPVPPPAVAAEAPAPPAPPPLPTVQDALELELRTRTRPERARLAELTSGLEAISRVHRTGALPRIPLQDKGLRGSTMGAYAYNGLGPVRIIVNPKAPTPRITLAHEVGHFLDNTVLNKSTDRRAFGSVNNPDMKPLMEAIRGTENYKTLQNVHNSRGVFTAADGRVVQYPSSATRYLMSDEELFARAYAQFIAEESGDRGLLDELGMELASPLIPTQWTREDFAPVRRAFQALFRKAGWM